jgi:RHS repeat-associated protein
VITDAAGVVVKTLEYDSFGKKTSDSNPGFDLQIGYAGGLEDMSTGFVRFGFRDHDPETGRWTTRDPILFEGGQFNLYTYVNNDPINLRDPIGLFSASVSAYAGIGAGVKLSVTRNGISWCGELGAGIGADVDVRPFDDALDPTGASTKIFGEIGFDPLFSLGGELRLCQDGSSSFTPQVNIGPARFEPGKPPGQGMGVTNSWPLGSDFGFSGEVGIAGSFCGQVTW